MLVASFSLLCLVGSIFGADLPAGSANAARGDAVKSPQPMRSAASPDEQDKARFHGHHNYYNSWASSPQVIPVASYPYQAPFFSHVSQPISHIPVSSCGSASHSIPIQPIASTGVAHAPVSPVAISQSTYTKPVLSYQPQVVQKPSYVINEHVVHSPVVTEVQQVVRRPVITEVQQVIHKPIFTEYQQVFKLPTYTQHIIRKPGYNALKTETLKAPLYLSSEQYHVVDKPTSHVYQQPPQYVQPYATEIIEVPTVHHQAETHTTVHVPSVPSPAHVPSISSPVQVPSPVHVPAVSTVPTTVSTIPVNVPSYPYIPSSSYIYGNSYGNGFGNSYGSSYGNSYGNGFGSSYGSYGTFGEHDLQFITPSTCRGKECEWFERGSGDVSKDMFIVRRPEYSLGQQVMEYLPQTYSATPFTSVPSSMINPYAAYSYYNFKNYNAVQPNNQAPNQPTGSYNPSSKGKDAEENAYFATATGGVDGTNLPPVEQSKPNENVDENVPTPELNPEEFNKMLTNSQFRSTLFSLFEKTVQNAAKSKSSTEVPVNNPKNKDQQILVDSIFQDQRSTQEKGSLNGGSSDAQKPENNSNSKQ